MTADIDRVLVFCDVVESGGFAQAAVRRGTVHSTISRQVRELERSLGVTLMTRTTRRKQLTAAGELVFRHGREIGKRYRELLHDLSRMEQIVAGELRVQSLVHVGAALVMPAAEQFRTQFPKVGLRLHFDDGPLSFHQSGLDLAITVGLPSAEDLVVRKLCDNEVVLVAAPSLVEQFGAPQAPTDLLSWPVVAYRSGAASLTSWAYEVDGQIHILEVHPSLTVNDGVSLHAMVRRGLGVGYLSRFSVSADLENGTLVELLPTTRLPPYNPVYTVKADLELVSPAVEAFERCLLTEAKRVTES
ncbi:MAG: LysR family transcriptional regulator [Myxococcota bacterium]